MPSAYRGGTRGAGPKPRSIAKAPGSGNRPHARSAKTLSRIAMVVYDVAMDRSGLDPEDATMIQR